MSGTCLPASGSLWREKSYRHERRWLRRHGHWARLASCFLSVALAAELVRYASRYNLVWLANGVLLAFLLVAARRHWPALMAVGMAGQLAGSALAGVLWPINLALTLLNLLEVLISAWLLRGRSTVTPQFTERTYLMRFVAFAMLAGPVATGGLVALIQTFLPNLGLTATAAEWTTSDSLGIGIATPVVVQILLGRFNHHFRANRHGLYLLSLVVVTLATFSQNMVPLRFFIYPLLIVILLRMGMGWAAVSTLFVSIAGNWFTTHGLGPFAAPNSLSPVEPFNLFQFFIGSAVFMLYSIAVVLEQEQKSVRELEKIAALHALVSESSRDAIIFSDLNGHRSYASTAGQKLEWRPEDLLTRNGVEMVHPDDQERAQSIACELNAGRESAMIECRIRNRDGEYIWVEASLRVIHDPQTGRPSGILNVVRDVSERKLAEQRLQEAYNAVEALAVTDSLTGLANRRRFDQYLSAEWRRSMRDHQPLSLLMLDVDKFKAYNDTYGHQRGDSCLKQIAEACMDVVSRPGDLVARFGGEEFVVVLPNTESEGAIQVGNEICEALRSRRLPHSGNVLGIVTISAGCATVIPKFGKHAPDLVEMADKALYKAKLDGRNMVVNGNLFESDPVGGASVELVGASGEKTA